MVKMCITIPGEIYEKLITERKETRKPVSNIIAESLSERYDLANGSRWAEHG